MKRNTLVILLIVLALILTVPAAFAQTFPSGGGSGIQAVNLDTTAATISATYYAQDGTQYALQDVILNNQGDSYTYFGEPVEASTFSGSAILSADKQIAAIANTGFSSNNSGGAYGGSNTGATTVLLPLVTKAFGGQTTAIGIQNTDTANSVTAHVIFTPQTGTAIEKDYVLNPGASQIIDLGTDGDFADNWIGSASISPSDGSTPLVASAMIYTNNYMYAYSGFTSTGTQWYLPLVRSNFASQLTGIQVVNATASAVAVTMNYNGTLYNSDYSSAGAYTCTVEATLPASGSVTFYNLNTWAFDDVLGATASAITGGDCQTNNHTNFSDAGDMFLGSASVTTNGEVAVVVNDLNSSGTSSGAYNGFLAADAAASIISPLARVNFYGITSGTQVQNICGSTVTAEATYNTGDGSQNQTAPVVPAANIASGSSFTFFTADSTYDGWLGSVIVADTSTTDGSKCLVGITNDAPGSGDASLFNTFAMP